MQGVAHHWSMWCYYVSCPIMTAWLLVPTLPLWIHTLTLWTQNSLSSIFEYMKCPRLNAAILCCISYAWGTLCQSCWQLPSLRLRNGKSSSTRQCILPKTCPHSGGSSWSTLASRKYFAKPERVMATLHDDIQPVFFWQKYSVNISCLLISSVTPLHSGT